MPNSWSVYQIRVYSLSEYDTKPPVYPVEVELTQVIDSIATSKDKAWILEENNIWSDYALYFH